MDAVVDFPLHRQVIYDAIKNKKDLSIQSLLDKGFAMAVMTRKEKDLGQVESMIQKIYESLTQHQNFGIMECAEKLFSETIKNWNNKKRQEEDVVAAVFVAAFHADNIINQNIGDIEIQCNTLTFQDQEGGNGYYKVYATRPELISDDRCKQFFDSTFQLLKEIF